MIEVTEIKEFVGSKYICVFSATSPPPQSG